MNDRERDQLRHDICRGIDAAILNADITIDQKCAAMTIAADAAIRALSGQERKGLVVGEDFERFARACRYCGAFGVWYSCNIQCKRHNEDSTRCAEHLCPRLARGEYD